MQKIFSIITVFLSVCLQGFAQQFINLYQDNVVIKQYSTEEIDSMSVSETEPRIVSFWRDGDVFQTYNAADIDSIKVSNRGGAPLSYIGIVGFNSQLQTKDIGILSPSTASQYMSFVSNLPKRDGSILYYAVDNALDMLEDAHIESPLKSVNVITFTDGLDQGSLMMTDKYSSSAAYIDALDERIAQAKDSELSPNFIALGLRGSDVSDMSQFRQNLQRLASSADNVFEVSSISDLRAKFQDIANQIISVSTRQSMSVRVIGVETGTRMRFVFDGNSAATSELYIEGTFNLQDLSLHNVTYHGIKATSGKTVQGTQDGIFVTYTFTGMRLEAGTSLIPTSSVKHYYMYPSSTSWQANSEFTPTGNTQRNVSHSGTLIFLVLDCSSSLGSDFSRMQQYANEFIDLIASNAEPFERLLSPTNVKASIDENNLVVNVSWDAVKYAESYNVYRSNSSNGTYELVAEGVTSTTWTDDSPLEGNNYYKVCAEGYGFTSSQSSYSYVNVSLAAPTNVRAVIDENDLVVNVSWETVKYAQSYNVYRSDSKTGMFVLVAENVTSTYWKDRTPLSKRNYYKVSAFGNGMESIKGWAVPAVPASEVQSFAVDGVTFTMIKVTGGTFKMGSDRSSENATPIHDVTLSDYYIGENEVTQELWQVVMGYNPSYHKGSKRPVDNVSWQDCQTFIKKLNELTGHAFRLPTEAEWEFAAKGGIWSEDFIYSGSNDIDNVAWYGGNSYYSGDYETKNVGTKAPNELGIYDMTGNVEEYCQDWYGEYSGSHQINPTGPVTGSKHIQRGGSFASREFACTTTFRHDDYIGPFDYDGLRIVSICSK